MKRLTLIKISIFIIIIVIVGACSPTSFIFDVINKIFPQPAVVEESTQSETSGITETTTETPGKREKSDEQLGKEKPFSFFVEVYREKLLKYLQDFDSGEVQIDKSPFPYAFKVESEQKSDDVLISIPMVFIDDDISVDILADENYRHYKFLVAMCMKVVVSGNQKKEIHPELAFLQANKSSSGSDEAKWEKADVDILSDFPAGEFSPNSEGNGLLMFFFKNLNIKDLKSFTLYMPAPVLPGEKPEVNQQSTGYRIPINLPPGWKRIVNKNYDEVTLSDEVKSAELFLHGSTLFNLKGPGSALLSFNVLEETVNITVNMTEQGINGFGNFDGYTIAQIPEDELVKNLLFVTVSCTDISNDNDIFLGKISKNIDLAQVYLYRSIIGNENFEAILTLNLQQ